MEQLKQMLDFAVATAQKAGRMVYGKMHGNFSVEHKSAYDFVTDIDRMSERMIRQAVAEAYPKHKFFGEETVSSGNLQEETLIHGFLPKDVIWIVDPIDGTTNFVRGIPQFSVSIGVMHQLEIQAAVIYDPCRDETFSAIKDEGAFLNGKRIHVTENRQLADSILSTSFPSSGVGQREYNVALLGRINRGIASLRIWNCASLSLAYVACGRTDAHFETAIHIWDMAAGKLIVEEAGGRATGLNGAAYRLDQTNIMATNGKLTEQLLNLLRCKEKIGIER